MRASADIRLVVGVRAKTIAPDRGNYARWVARHRCNRGMSHIHPRSKWSTSPNRPGALHGCDQGPRGYVACAGGGPRSTKTQRKLLRLAPAFLREPRRRGAVA